WNDWTDDDAGYAIARRLPRELGKGVRRLGRRVGWTGAAPGRCRGGVCGAAGVRRQRRDAARTDHGGERRGPDARAGSALRLRLRPADRPGADLQCMAGAGPGAIWLVAARRSAVDAAPGRWRAAGDRW